jgi:hypothetical protein
VLAQLESCEIILMEENTVRPSIGKTTMALADSKLYEYINTCGELL